MKQAPDEFAETLRDGAKRESPEFSDELHTRVMAAVRREDVRAGVSLSPWRLLFVPLGTVVAVLISIVVLLKHSSAPPAPVVELPNVPQFGQVIRETAGPVRQKLEDARFAYLDRDGKRLAKFLWRSIPGTSSQSSTHHDSPSPS